MSKDLLGQSICLEDNGMTVEGTVAGCSGGGTGGRLSKPLHLLELEQLLDLDGFIRQVKTMVPQLSCSQPLEDLPVTSLSKQQLRAAKSRLYNCTKVKKGKKWLKNVLVEKSDTEESDYEVNGNPSSDDLVKDKKAALDSVKEKNELNELPSSTPQSQNFTSLLSTIGDGPSILTDICFPVTKENKKQGKSCNNKATTKRKVQTSSSPSLVNTSASNTTPSSPLVSLSNEIPISPPITTTTTNASSILNTIATVDSYSPESLLLIDSKRTKMETKMLDDIQYDATLPDEILQSESGDSEASIELEPSLTPSIADEVNFVNQLSDDTYNTEESSASLLSQCASQPANSVSGPATVTQPKCMTAPTTPTGSRPNSPSLMIISSSNKKGSKTKNCSNNSGTYNSLSHEVRQSNMAIKRRKIWISIARKDIPRAQKRRISIRKKSLANCRKMAKMATTLK